MARKKKNHQELIKNDGFDQNGRHHEVRTEKLMRFDPIYVDFRAMATHFVKILVFFNQEFTNSRTGRCVVGVLYKKTVLFYHRAVGYFLVRDATGPKHIRPFKNLLLPTPNTRRTQYLTHPKFQKHKNVHETGRRGSKINMRQ